MEQELCNLWWKKGDDLGRVAILTSGNDLQDGPEHCRDALDHIMKWSNAVSLLTIYSTIPAYSFKQNNVEFDVSVPAGAAGSLVVGDDVLYPTPVGE